MAKQRINLFQIFALTLIFQIGSTTLFALGIDAKQDAWLAILIALVAGLALIWLYTEIQDHYPDLNLAEIFIAVLGKRAAIPFISSYALFFFYISSFNLYEFCEFIVQSYLLETPIEAILLITASLVVYSLILEIEVISRSSELLLPYFLLFIIGTYLLVGASGGMKLQELTPVLEGGILPVLKAASQIITFPFGEMVVFLMYWRYATNKQAIRNISLVAVGFSGLLLTISLVCMIAVLGVELVSIQSIPLFRMINHINVGDFIQRIDAFGGAILFIGGFYKMILYFNASRLAVAALINIKQQKWLIIGMTVLWLMFIQIYFTDFTFYRWVGTKIVNPYLMLPYVIIIPCLLLFLIKLKIKLGREPNRTGV